MKLTNKVIWNEGLFIQPHHFQQQDRYLESYVHSKTKSQPFNWGFYNLKLDNGLLANGKIAIVQAQGVLPDGTPFDIPGTHKAPEPLSIDEIKRSDTPDKKSVCLCLAQQDFKQKEVEFDTQSVSSKRYIAEEIKLYDRVTHTDHAIEAQVAGLNLQLTHLNAHKNRSGGLQIALIQQASKQGMIELDDEFIPPYIDAQAHPVLQQSLSKLTSLLFASANKEIKKLAQVISGHQELIPIMLSAALNRWHVHFEHLSQLIPLAPERLYQALIECYVEIHSLKNIAMAIPASVLVPYDHNHSGPCFLQLFDKLNQLLLEDKRVEDAINLTISEMNAHIHFIEINQKLEFYRQHEFYLAVSTDLEKIVLNDSMDNFVISDIEQLETIKISGIKGISLEPLLEQPAGIPYSDDYAYQFFKLDKRSGLDSEISLWPQSDQSKGFGLYVHEPDNLPSLHLKFWALPIKKAQRLS